MIIRKTEQEITVKEHLRAGKGSAEMRRLLAPEQFCGHGRMFNVITLEPGCSIGWHMHEGESETYYILEGTAALDDNGKPCVLQAGDVSHTASGEGHSIENTGDSPLRLIALIVKG